MSRLPPPRAPREQVDIIRYARPKTHIPQETPKKVGEVLGTKNTLPGKKRPFYPLWEKTRTC